MSSSSLSLIPMVFSQLLTQIPVLVVCIVSLVVLAGRRGTAAEANPDALNWAIVGFGVSAALSFLLPLVYGVLTFVQIHGNLPIGSIRWVYPILGVFSALLHAGAYAIFLVAYLRFLKPAPRAP